MHQPVAAPGGERGFVESRIVADDGHGNSLASLSVGQAKDSTLSHSGTLANDPLHNLWIDVVTTGDYQIVLAADQRQEARRVNLPQVARVEPAAQQRLARRFGLVPVGAKQVRPANLHRAHFARSSQGTVLAND